MFIFVGSRCANRICVSINNSQVVDKMLETVSLSGDAV